MKYPSCLDLPYLKLDRCVENFNNIYSFIPAQKPAKIYIVCILRFNVSLCGLAGRKRPRSIPYSIFVLKFFLFRFVSPDL